MNRLYVVKAKFGHVGRNRFVLKEIPIKANDGKEAALKARNTPRVKHNWKDAIVNVREVTYSEYLNFLFQHEQDLFFKCKNVQQQRVLCKDIYKETIQNTSISRNNRSEKLKYLFLKRKVEDEHIVNDV